MSDPTAKSFWDEPSAFHARLLPPSDLPTIWEAIDSAATASGILTEGGAPMKQSERRHYRFSGSGRAFGVSLLEEDGVGWHLLMSPAYDLRTGLEEADAICSFLGQACPAAGVLLGRSFNYAVANGYITPDELDGPLRWIDWLQYFGPSILERLGKERLSALPVFGILDAPGGGVVVRVSQLPDDGFARRPLAQHLGISLRPCATGTLKRRPGLRGIGRGRTRRNGVP